MAHGELNQSSPRGVVNIHQIHLTFNSLSSFSFLSKIGHIGRLAIKSIDEIRQIAFFTSFVLNRWKRLAKSPYSLHGP